VEHGVVSGGCGFLAVHRPLFGDVLLRIVDDKKFCRCDLSLTVDEAEYLAGRLTQAVDLARLCGKPPKEAA
jgi:hypothetical protein